MLSIREKLLASRRELLDLSARNKLVHTPLERVRAKAVRVVDEVSDQVFRALVEERKSLGFHPLNDASAQFEVGFNAQSDGSEAGARHVDAWLQTTLDPDSLQRRLLGVYYDAKTFEEEQGVGILYLALGFLKWFESSNSDIARYSPLVLLPVQLARSGTGQRFQISALEEDLSVNLSLQAKHQSEFNIHIPDLPEADELIPSQYFQNVGASIKQMPRWEVLPNEIFLGFFSFAKYLMYRDLAPEAWPEGNAPDTHPLVSALLGEAGFVDGGEPLCGEKESIDDYLTPEATVHVLDSDSSQAIAIEEVRRGRNLVVQGPPGTGKSQTITNMIAACVRDGKRVLFVAEKMAALEVVSQRLARCGLADIFLELHSGKSNKKEVISELGRTLDLGSPKSPTNGQLLSELARTRQQLNEYLKSLHSPNCKAGTTPFDSIGALLSIDTGGKAIPEIPLDGYAEWSSDQLHEIDSLIKNVVSRLDRIGVPSVSAWHGVTLATVLPTDLPRIQNQLNILIAVIDGASDTVSKFSRSIRCSQSPSIAGNSIAIKVAQHLLAAPPMDRTSLANAAWAERRSDVSALVKRGKTYAERRTRLQAILYEEAWTADFRALRGVLATYGGSWMRWLSRDWRKSQKTLREYFRNAPPQSPLQQLELLDELLQSQTEGNGLETQASALGQAAFGKVWRGRNSDWEQLRAIDEWEHRGRTAQLPGAFRKVAAAVNDRSAVETTLKELNRDLQTLFATAQALCTQLQVDLKATFGFADIREIPLDLMRQKCLSWQHSIDFLPSWSAFWNSLSKLRNIGQNSLADSLYSGDLPPELASKGFQLRYHEESLRQALSARPALADFDGIAHQRLIDRFRELDLQRIELARHEVAAAHHARLPARVAAGEVAIIRREIEKKRSHKPLRTLLREAGRAIQAIKPVFMMSPTSVAQFLEPGGLEFDVVMIDEASQIRPVDALGAIGRAKQLVVVGDDKQLPPTQFFDKVLDDSADHNESEDFSIGDIESILGLCNAQGVPPRMLQWHYRSEHHSLIAVSNQEFYEGKLFIVPSPSEQSDLGLQFQYCPNGVFDRGQSTTNRIEARMVAEAAIEHARLSPSRSLGIAAFSVAQRDAILDEMELLRKANPDCDSFFSQSANEPFFVKALEHVQGDERDSILISIGYGRDANGKFLMNFGPLQMDGGERRLNVLISRAKRRCVVFSSISADDIDLTRARSRGVAALKKFLKYARDKQLETDTPTDRGHDSDFELQVHRALQSHGYEIEPQVGIAGFFIDLAVKDPAHSGRFLLGIECDGRSYHSSRSARDRDRLRQAVLEKCGWTIHRIWSTDWFRTREIQLRKTIQAIEDAKSSVGTDRLTDRNGNDNTKISRHNSSATHTRVPIETIEYRTAAFHVTDSRPIFDLQPSELASYIFKVVAVEGPIHEQLIIRRLVELWGGQRTSKRIVDACDASLKWNLRNGKLVADGDFYSLPAVDSPQIRHRGNTDDSSLRRPHTLPPIEIQEALKAIVKFSISIAPQELQTEAAKLFGISATVQFKEVISRELDSLVATGHLTQQQDRILLPSNETTAG